MRKNVKNLLGLLPLAVVAMLLGSCAATACNQGACKAREISSVNENADDDAWAKRPQMPKLRGEY